MQEFLYLHSNSPHPDLSPSRINRDQRDVNAVQDTVTSMFIEPFEELNLLSISSGIVPTDKVKANLLDAMVIGEREYLKFQKERLVKQSIGFYDSLSKLVRSRVF